jgi:D-glycero-alpha-D-manno-heptose 1-phosphate guanylyltransferase
LEAIVLAGGFGTRLHSVVPDVPKPMADINGKPFLDYVLAWLKSQNIDRIILAVGYKADVIQKYFGNSVLYSYELEPLGTGGAIKKALSVCDDEYVYVINGDTLFCANLCINPRSDMTMYCRYVENADRYGLIQIERGYATAINEKQANSNGYINGGIYVMKRDLLNGYPQKFSFETLALPDIMACGKIRVIKSEAYFIDIGIPEDYERAKQELKTIIY